MRRAWRSPSPGGTELAVLALDVILALVLLEGAALIAFHWRTGRGIAPRPLVATLAAGFFVMLALRLALGAQSEAAIAACLLASLVAHVADLAGRWRPRS